MANTHSLRQISTPKHGAVQRLFDLNLVHQSVELVSAWCWFREGYLGVANPFDVDAALCSEHDLAQLTAHGGATVKAFCGIDDSAKNWGERGVCVVRARKGFGKSHLLTLRSINHRSSNVASRTIFYPQGGRRSRSVDALSSLNVAVPRWLQGKESVAPWVQVWQLAIVGLMTWISGAKTQTLKGYADWFGSIEALEQVQRQNRADAPEAARPHVMLAVFMGRILERLPLDDFNLGTDTLKQGLYHANSDWAIAVAASLANRDKTGMAMYLDAPDELVELTEPTLWRNIQQGLLLAIWKFSKSTTWSHLLNIYASVRSEAFGSGHDHPDVSLAMGLVMSLRYSRNDLECILSDRIRLADPTRLTCTLTDGVEPVYALCGIHEVRHDNRSTLSGARYVECIFDSILRHTRRVPREVIAIGGAIYEIQGARTFETVRKAVNAQASQNIADAIEHSFHGWNDALHKTFVTYLRSEVMDARSLGEIAQKFGSEGPKVIKFFVQHGLFGISEPQPQRYKHYYVQRFAFDEVHGYEESSSVNKDYFFMHPAFKEWTLSLPEQLNRTFERLKVGVIGDQQPFEAMPPILRLGASRGQVQLKLRTNRRIATYQKDISSDPLRFLFVAIWACREFKQTRVSIAEFNQVWSKLQSTGKLGAAVHLAIPDYIDDFVEKIRDWQKKINKDPDIKDLQCMFAGKSFRSRSISGKNKFHRTAMEPFMSVSAKGDIGAQAEIFFSKLNLEEVDWDEDLYKIIADVDK